MALRILQVRIGHRWDTSGDRLWLGLGLLRLWLELGLLCLELGLWGGPCSTLFTFVEVARAAAVCLAPELHHTGADVALPGPSGDVDLQIVIGLALSDDRGAGRLGSWIKLLLGLLLGLGRHTSSKHLLREHPKQSALGLLRLLSLPLAAWWAQVEIALAACERLAPWRKPPSAAIAVPRLRKHLECHRMTGRIPDLRHLTL